MIKYNLKNQKRQQQFKNRASTPPNRYMILTKSAQASFY
jgi:hypothetical protein